MRKILPTLYIVLAAIIIVASALGGAIADRLFVIKPLNSLFPDAQRIPLAVQNTSGERQIVREESIVTSVVKDASESVVTIAVTKQQSPSINDFFLDPFGMFSIPQQQEPETVQQDIGSGFVVDKSGLIVTNKHVVADSSAKYKVILKDNTEINVDKIYRDPSNDLAILKVEAQLKPLTLGTSENLEVGQFVIAIGTALGEFRETVTTGVISGLGRGIQAGNQFGGFVEQLDNVIQTDAAINPGNSGGPLLDTQARVIGVNAAVAAQAQNIGFAIPINVVKDSLNNFFQTGEFNRPFLGIRYRMIPKETALLNDVPEGALVVEVINGSSAATSGIQQNDIITKFDGTEVKAEKGGLATMIAKKKVGDTISVELWRDGSMQTVSLKLQAAPQN